MVQRWLANHLALGCRVTITWIVDNNATREMISQSVRLTLQVSISHSGNHTVCTICNYDSPDWIHVFPWDHLSIKMPFYQCMDSHQFMKNKPVVILRLIFMMGILITRKMVFILKRGPGGRLNIKMSSYQYRDHHVKDKTVSPTVLSLTWESPYLEKAVLKFILKHGPALGTRVQCSLPAGRRAGFTMSPYRAGARRRRPGDLLVQVIWFWMGLRPLLGWSGPPPAHWAKRIQQHEVRDLWLCDTNLYTKQTAIMEM